MRWKFTRSESITSWALTAIAWPLLFAWLGYMPAGVLVAGEVIALGMLVLALRRRA